MKVCLLSSAHTPVDKRVFEKEGKSLAAAGYDVVHLAPGTEPSRQQDGVWLEIYPPTKPGLVSRLGGLFRLYRRAGRLNADVYHCNEVDSWVVGVVLKLLRRKKVGFDVHEHYPSRFERLRPRLLAWTAACMLRFLFRCLTPITDFFVFAKRSVAADFPNTAERSIVVLNTAPRGSATALERPGDKQFITAVHVGLIGSARGWPQLAEALRLVKSPKLRVKIIGKCNDSDTTPFLNTFAAPDLRERVEIIDWMPIEQMYSELAKADIGLILFQPGVLNHVYAMPHKLFDYMRMGLAVIMPEFAEEVAPIVREEDCGLLLDPSDPKEIAEALDRLVQDDALRVRYGDNGREAVTRKYNWENEAKLLIDLYRKLEPNRAK